MSAHRAAWIEVNGPVPEGLYVRHLCHTKACVRPDHLAPGTQAENFQDNRDAGRPVNKNAAKTHCPQGHPYDLLNTGDYIDYGYRHRVCLTCKRERAAAKRAAKRT